MALTAVSETQTLDAIVENKWTDAVNDLVALTESRDIQWTTADSSSFPALGKDTSDREIAVQAVYEAEYKEKRLQLQETGVQLPQVGNPLQNGTFSGGWRKPVVQEVALRTADGRLRLLDAKANVVFVFPQTPNMVELLAAVKYQIADVESFLKMLHQDVSAVSSQ